MMVKEMNLYQVIIGVWLNVQVDFVLTFPPFGNRSKEDFGKVGVYDRIYHQCERFVGMCS